jgi:hypothetical protein
MVITTAAVTTTACEDFQLFVIFPDGGTNGEGDPCDNADDADIPCGTSGDMDTHGDPMDCELDERAPEVILAAVIEMWPPNHDYMSFTLADCIDKIWDDCDGSLEPDVNGRIVSIYSDEPENSNGDGNTTVDIVIDHDTAFRLRSERLGGGNGRVYGIAFEVWDEAGNITAETCFITAPHDQSGDAAINDGAAAGYSVDS